MVEPTFEKRDECIAYKLGGWIAPIQLGYRAILTANGPETPAAIENGALLDILLTDMIMPGGAASTDGSWRKRFDCCARARVLFTSGFTRRDHPSWPARSCLICNL